MYTQSRVQARESDIGMDLGRGTRVGVVCACVPTFIPDFKNLYCILNLRVLLHCFFSRIKKKVLDGLVRCCHLTWGTSPV